jgi:hypothetical protein
MSDMDSDSSTDSDNNNSSPFFNHYLGYPRGYYEHDIESPGLETDDSSDSDVIPNLSHFDSTSSDVSFHSSYLIYFIFIFILSF